MESNIHSARDTAIALFKDNSGLFCCPVCGKKGKIHPDGKLVCAKKHSFDISHTGYINIAASGSLKGYTKDLFLNRRAVFEAGFYNTLCNILVEMIKMYTNCNPCLRVIDVGCGEGTITERISQAFTNGVFIGADLSRDAIELASRQRTRIMWLVSDLARLPLQDRVFSSVLNVLAPANYSEFRRILMQGGVLIKVMPGNDYLKEYRAFTTSISENERKAPAYMAHQMKILALEKIQHTYKVNAEQSRQFFGMTPLTADIRKTPEEKELPQEVTIDLVIAAGRFRY